MELSNTIKSKIMQSTNQGYTMKGQWGQIWFRWWFHTLFDKTRWRRQELEVWWASQEKMYQSTIGHNFQLNPNQPCAHYNAYGYDANHYFTFHS
jgi:hypothetical protein